MIMKRFFPCAVLFFTCASASAECWVVTNVQGTGAYQYNQYTIKNDGFAGKEFAINIDKKSPSVTDSLMTYTVISPTAMVGEYATELGLTLQTWQISTDRTKAFMTINRTNTNNIMQDTVAAFVGDVKGKCAAAQ